MDEKTREYLKKADHKDVLKYFSEISAVPRGSYYNRKISDFLAGFAREKDVKFIQDDALNIIMFKDAHPCPAFDMFKKISF